MSSAPTIEPDIEGGGTSAAQLPDVVRLFEDRAAQRGSALAVATGAGRLSYAELDARANALARSLRDEGVGPEVLVGIGLERSLEMVVAALATLKAGGAYVPLDPSYPEDRLLFMLGDSGARVLLTHGALGERLAAGSWKTIDVDLDAAALDERPAASVERSLSPGDLAYVIYTSGTTGRPKGVEVTHGSLSNLVAWHLRAFGVTASDRATQLAGPGFDAAVWEIWPALAAGASLHLADEVTRVSPELLRDWLVSERITISFLPTPLAEAALSLSWPAESALRILLTGADTLHRRPPADLPFALVNNYGPTEATVVATSGIVAPESVESDAGQLPSIGRPIDGTIVRILDDELRPVPDGEPGELCIGGAGLARGYRARSALTAQRFVPDPLGAEPGARLYRTGDRARVLAGGRLAFLGRLDGQIKIRGHRIEPDELVSILNGHPAVQASAVAAREDGGEKVLVAYVVPAPGVPLGSRELAELLKRALPDSMLPDLFVRLENLPLTLNGKLDREALPAPAAENLMRDEGARAPSSPVEERLLTVVASLLGVPEVGVEDNFFLAGGHSMMGTQLIARVRDAFGVELTLRTLFEAPTVAGLAFEVEGRLRAMLEAMSEDDARQMLQGGAPRESAVSSL